MHFLENNINQNIDKINQGSKRNETSRVIQKKSIAGKIAALFFASLLLSAFFMITAFAETNGTAETTVTSEKTTTSSSGTAKIYITTTDKVGASLEKDDGYVEGEMKVYAADGTRINESVTGKVKVRGNSTALAPKKPYTFKFDEAVDLFDIGSAKKWSLLANCFDPTLVRNSTAFELGLLLNSPYTLGTKMAEVWMDGVYKGCYLLTGSIETGETRVDIDTSKGEFLLEMEMEREEEDVTYVEAGTNDVKLRFAVSDPEEPTEEELSHIQAVLDEAVEKCTSGRYSLTQTIIDIDSFAACYLLNEIVENVDFSYSSTYFYYKDGKLYAGPIWDFDKSFGNANPDYADSYKSALSTEGSFAKQGFMRFLWLYDPFIDFVKEKARENCSRIEWLYRDGGYIDDIVAKNRIAIDRNYSEAGWDVSHAYVDNIRTPDSTYDENVDYLKNWLKSRHEWICKEYGIDIEEEKKADETKKQSGGTSQKKESIFDKLHWENE